MIENKKFPGKEVQFQGHILELPPLNFEAYYLHGAFTKIKNIQKALLKLQTEQDLEIITTEVMDDIFALVLMSAKLNYPDITKDEIMQMLTLDSIGPVMEALVSQNNTNGLKEEVRKNARK